MGTRSFGKFALPDSIKSKQEIKKDSQGKGAAPLLPQPRTMGSFIILIMVLSFAAGGLRNELALTLLGTVFLIILIYCFIGVFLYGIIYRKKAQLLSIAVSPETASVGMQVELCVKTGNGFPPENKFFLLPAILMRYELRLETKDGRVMRQFASPDDKTHSCFTVKERGAYYSSFLFTKHLSKQGDRFIIFDAPGFFRLSLPLHQDEGVRLLAVPSPSGEPSYISLKSSGNEERAEPHYRKSDNFTDNRPYIPGDDPRRINWKLYGHAPLGELFVREGVPEPPLHSRLIVLVDTEVDPLLYTLEEGRQAVDLLCETAMSVVAEYQNRGMDIHIGYTGGKIMDGKELIAALALPYAIFSPTPKSSAELPRAELPRAELQKAELPPVPKNTATLVLALPRTFLESALEKFIKSREIKQAADIVFLFNAESGKAAELEEAANICVNLYNGRSGIYIAKIAVAPGRNREEGS
jgi:hypothetical protein